jgi:hypothetical protein
MKYPLMFLFALALGGTVACGGTEHEAHHGGEQGEHHEHGEHGEHEEHHEAHGPAGEFHDVLAPIWHSDTGAARTEKACEATKTMRARAAAVVAAPPPEGAKADDYKAAAKGLSDAVDALSAACGAPDRPEVDAQLSAVHDAFHKVAEMEHGGHEHGEHEHH